MTANYEKEQKDLLELVADGKKNLLDAEQTKVDLRLLMKVQIFCIEQNTVQPPVLGATPYPT